MLYVRGIYLFIEKHLLSNYCARYCACGFRENNKQSGRISSVFEFTVIIHKSTNPLIYYVNVIKENGSGDRRAIMREI